MSIAVATLVKPEVWRDMCAEWRKVENHTYLYFIQAGEDGPIKIGVAAKPLTRLRQFQTASAEDLRLRVACWGSAEAEQFIHALLKGFGAHIRGEWFRPIPELLAAIEELEWMFDWDMREMRGEITEEEWAELEADLLAEEAKQRA